MTAKIQKWGNSLGVRIPKAIIEQASLCENAEVTVEHKNGAIMIFPVKTRYVLNDLLEKITKKNLHSEDDFTSEGNEVW
ncbi:MAG: AbrB/MazE/SpoVT family DNA-binding domain-containing protein [Bacteriovoracaceae bacterium]|nr:AbrB/MazE/SpoVT family DNA-binding domain-containing protein [Bacteriovoracaceae bacterium]